MALLRTLCFFLSLAVPLQGAPTTPVTRKDEASAICENPIVCTEWQRLAESDRSAYINAVKWTMQKPAQNSEDDAPGATNHFWDFIATHIAQTTDVHFSGRFHSYHRWLLHNYERELQAYGYEGAQPYWDWTLDSGSAEGFLGSPVFDAESGFRGNGDYVPGNFTNPAPGMAITVLFDIPYRTGGGCIPTGLF